MSKEWEREILAVVSSDDTLSLSNKLLVFKITYCHLNVAYYLDWVFIT